jgi:hypothetical protein
MGIEDEGKMRGGREGGKYKMKDSTSIVNITIIDAPPRADVVEEVRGELEVLGEGGFLVVGTCPCAADAVGVYEEDLLRCVGQSSVQRATKVRSK